MQPATIKALARSTAPDIIRHKLFTRITLPPRLTQRLPTYQVSHEITIGDSPRGYRCISATVGEIPVSALILPENLDYLQAYREHNDHKDHGKNKQGKRQQHFHRKLVGLFLRAQHPFAAHFVTEHPKRLADVAA